MLQLIFQRNFDFTQFLSIAISSLAVIFLTLPAHEWAHAFVATKLGDPTPKWQNRLSLNPFKHIDYIGALCIIFLGIGWAKPVEVNMQYFKNPKRDMAITALAGPLMNLLIAFVLLLILNLLSLIFELNLFVYYVFIYFSYINTSLAIFNLLPVPPFDGSRILNAFLPDRIYYKIMQYEQIIFYVVLFILFTGAGSGVLSSITSTVFGFIYWLASILF